MMVAVRMPCRLPVLVLLGVLAAPAAWADDAPVALFPGTSVPGESVSGTSVSGMSVSDTGVEGWQESLPEQVPEPSDEAAPDVEAEAGVDASPSDAAVPDGNMAAENPATPAGGSRLLRVLAERPQTLVPETLWSGETARPEALRVFAAEGCPRALLRRLLAGAASEADALSALGIEREILTLCRERQEIVAGLFETEKRLSELREAGRGPEPEAPTPSAERTPGAIAAGGATAVETRAASPLRAALGDAADTRAADTRAAEPQGTLVPGNSLVQAPARVSPARVSPARASLAQVSPAQVSPRYAWFSIIGTAGALRAGVTDGSGVWFVREGDALPGGATIAAIAGRPPGVRVTGAGERGEATLLPFGARPGPGP